MHSGSKGNQNQIGQCNFWGWLQQCLGLLGADCSSFWEPRQFSTGKQIPGNDFLGGSQREWYTTWVSFHQNLCLPGFVSLLFHARIRCILVIFILPTLPGPSFLMPFLFSWPILFAVTLWAWKVPLAGACWLLGCCQMLLISSAHTPSLATTLKLLCFGYQLFPMGPCLHSFVSS